MAQVLNVGTQQDTDILNKVQQMIEAGFNEIILTDLKFVQQQDAETVYFADITGIKKDENACLSINNINDKKR